MSKFSVRLRGTDTSGRGIYATDYMWHWWGRVCDDLGFTPTIVQGAFMVRAGGGAAASAGYHDAGGCFDLRVWDRTDREQQRMVRTLRRFGAGAWIRDARHGGMDPHLHFVLGTDADLASGARWQWGRYLAGRDGLASDGPDYHWRPSPLVTTPPPEEGFTMDKEAKAAFNEVNRKLDRLDQFARHDRLRSLKALDRLADIAEAGADDATKPQVRRLREDLRAALGLSDDAADDSPRG